MKRLALFFLIAVSPALFHSESNSTISEAKCEEAARLLTAMLVSGRAVVARHQDLINNPDLGDKRFTPEYFEEKMLKDFEKTTGVKLQILDPEVRKVLEAMVAAAKQTVSNHESSLNGEDTPFKRFIPAIFGRNTGAILEYYAGIDIKQITFAPRNEYNRPDSYELEVLNKFRNGELPAGEGYGRMHEGKYRYVYPIYISQGCLKCHGEPEGELDIAGYKKEGYRIGDLRGGISVKFATK